MQNEYIERTCFNSNSTTTTTTTTTYYYSRVLCVCLNDSG